MFTGREQACQTETPSTQSGARCAGFRPQRLLQSGFHLYLTSHTPTHLLNPLPLRPIQLSMIDIGKQDCQEEELGRNSGHFDDGEPSCSNGSDGDFISVGGLTESGIFPLQLLTLQNRPFQNSNPILPVNGNFHFTHHHHPL